MAAKTQFQSLSNAKLALPSLLMTLHPVIGGIVLSTIMAAILSTVSPIILACGTMFTRDIYRKLFNPSAADEHLLNMSRMATGLAGVVCILLALLLYGGSTILDIVYFAYTLRGSLFVVLLFAIYWKKTSTWGAVWAMIFTALAGFVWVVLKKILGQYPIHPMFTETYISVIVAFLSTLILSVLFPEKRF
jgi:SSS family solute:Na+ symporter